MRKRPWIFWKRIFMLLRSAVRFSIFRFFFRITKSPGEYRVKLAEQAQREIRRLGPTFMKIAQWLSLRRELLPEEFCHAFESFFADASGDPALKVGLSQSDAMKCIKEEFGKTGKELFRFFDDKPIAVAPLSVVYRAQLMNGKLVAVKMQKPGIRPLMEQDMKCFSLALRFLSRSPSLRPFNVKGLVAELQKWLRNELDYLQEAYAMEDFRVKQKNDYRLVVPKVFWEYTTKRILVTEFINGHSVLDVMRAIDTKDSQYLRRLKADGIDLESVCEFLIENYLTQHIVHGFFHADPHPANIILLPQNSICYLDFGLVGTLSQKLQMFSVRLFSAILRGDPWETASLIIEIGSGKSACGVEHVVDRVNDLLKRLRADISYCIARLTYDIIIMMERQYSLVVPRSLLLAIRGMSTLDTIVARIAPRVDNLKIAEHALRRSVILREARDTNMPGSYRWAMLQLVMEHCGNYLTALGKIFRRD